MAIEKILVAAVTEEAGSGKLLKQKKIVSPSKKPTKSLKKVENSSLNIHLDMDTVWPLSENVSKTKDKIGKLKPTISSFVKTKVTTNKQRITEKKAVKKTGRVAIISKKSELKKIIFQLRFQTQYGQQLFIMVAKPTFSAMVLSMFIALNITAITMVLKDKKQPMATATNPTLQSFAQEYNFSTAAIYADKKIQQ